MVTQHFSLYPSHRHRAQQALSRLKTIRYRSIMALRNRSCLTRCDGAPEVVSYKRWNARNPDHRRQPTGQGSLPPHPAQLGIRGEFCCLDQMLRIRRDPQHRLRRGAEQQIVKHCLVVKGDAGDLVRQREDDVEITHGEQIGLPFRQPCPRGGSLALGAMPIAAAVIGDPPMPALLAGFDVTTQRGGTRNSWKRSQYFQGTEHSSRTMDSLRGSAGASRIARNRSCASDESRNRR